MTGFKTFQDQVGIKYYRTTAPSMRAFLTRLRDDGEILGSACDDCGHVDVPARDACPDCGADVDTFAPVGPEGDLLSWTRDADGEAFAVVRLDGADGAIVHRLLGDDEPEVGARVRTILADEREGRITDIAGFEVIA